MFSFSAPTAEVKFSLARCLVKLSPLNPDYVMTSLKNWINSIPIRFKEHNHYTETFKMIEFVSERLNNYNASKKSRTQLPTRQIDGAKANNERR